MNVIFFLSDTMHPAVWEYRTKLRFSYPFTVCYGR